MLQASCMAPGRSYDALAVAGNVLVPGYLVADKSNLTTCSPSDTGFTDYGFVVGGDVSTTGGVPSVRGNTYLSGSGNVNVK